MLPKRKEITRKKKILKKEDERVKQQQLALKDENQKAQDADGIVKHSTNFLFDWVDSDQQHGHIKDQLGHFYTWNRMKPRMEGGIRYKCTRLWEKRCTAVVRRIVTDDEEMMYLERAHSHPMPNKKKLDTGNRISSFHSLN